MGRVRESSTKKSGERAVSGWCAGAAGRIEPLHVRLEGAHRRCTARKAQSSAVRKLISAGRDGGSASVYPRCPVPAARRCESEQIGRKACPQRARLGAASYMQRTIEIQRHMQFWQAWPWHERGLSQCWFTAEGNTG